MRNHFHSSHRWYYVISAIVGGEHVHFIISQIFDVHSLFYIKSIIDAVLDGFAVLCDVNLSGMYDVVHAVDTSNGSYCVGYLVDCNTCYSVDNTGDYNR